MTRTTFSCFATLGAVSVLLLVTSCGEETGIPTRHLHGIVNLPPIGLWEQEPDQRVGPDLVDHTDENFNDVRETADGPFSISYGYHMVRGTIDVTCAEIDPEAPETNCQGNSDRDFFRFRSSYRGPIVFKTRMPADVEGDVDMRVFDATGSEVYNEDANNVTVTVENEETGEDETLFRDERYATQVEPGDEFYVRVSVNAAAGTAPYELIVVGEDPRRHDLNRGIEGDASDFVADVAEDVDLILPAFEILVGAYVNNDVENPGNPVGGTSCESWTLDEESLTFWCPWEMHFLQQVTTEANVIIEGFADGKDNDCNTIADTGNEPVDADGDGVAISQGDCNDSDPDVNPFQGDRFGDRKDNDCDGWADNGPDDVDDDGDGFCEIGFDVNGDGVCRGQVEIETTFAVGDCNDADPAINPQLNNEIPHNGIDDDCGDGDAILDTANSDGDRGVIEGLTPHDWTDLEEEACGTNPYDPNDRPQDLDGDGLCDSDCIGTVDCPQDWDGDGLHNWEEIQCSSDPREVTEEYPDFDGDGQCDGKDLDADNDGHVFSTPNNPGDCHDLNPEIHPHDTDETGEEVTRFFYDISNGIDDDCDGTVDENREWSRSGEPGNWTFVQDFSYQVEDQDGDGYPMGLRDCDDTDPDIFIGNYEVRSANVVNTDFSTVYLFAGDVQSLNQIDAQPDGRRTPGMVQYDLEKDRVTWIFNADRWEEDNLPPRLEPTGFEPLNAWFVKQPEIGKTWFEATAATGVEIPNDVEVSGFSITEGLPPYPEGTFQELGEAAGAGKTNEFIGNIDEISPDSWDGDNDTFHVTFPEAGFLDVSLNWLTGGGDYDMIVYCFFESSRSPAGYYGNANGLWSPGLTDATKPEEGRTVVPLPDGADCWFTVFGYSGSTGAYTVAMTPQGN
jgi:hypothetical protein